MYFPGTRVRTSDPGPTTGTRVPGYPVPDVGPGSDDGYPVPVADPGPFTKLGPTVAATASAVVLRATAQFPPLPLPRQPLSRSPSLYFTTVAAVHIAAFIGLWLILPLQSAFNSYREHRCCLTCGRPHRRFSPPTVY